MKKILVFVLISAFVSTGILCRKAADFPTENIDPRLSGGAATVFLSNSQAFGQMISGLSTFDQFIHELGDRTFEQTFVSAPAPHFPGLGPVFNNVSCISCHHNDGKGTPTMGAVTSSLLTRISIPGTDANGGPLQAEGFGLQIQDKANNGPVEAKVKISYEEIPFTFQDGQNVSLRKPTYTVTDPYRPLPADYMTSVRMAPPVFGLGLLERVSSSTILALADPADKDGDNISGKPNYVFNQITGKKELGRFGLKANVPTLMLQVASAYHQDMGITSYLFPEESSFGQPQYITASKKTNMADSLLDATTFYISTLAVPARRDVTDSGAIRGERLFAIIGCSSCHQPTLITSVDVRLPALSHQRIHPYTDLLLHDMGEGLADGRPDYDATGSEWRTMPLWGIGLFTKINGQGFYLHDGRARSITEAILWHGGEAKTAKDRFVQLTKGERNDLLKFLSSL